ncbi:unnamed protein product [Phytophthora fragariaefolia]|uniref:Unnamed protein product n=1 Tax=Phytophthora fragariaefolia TaxID=1490495 RepID=A0A9W6XS01_9STRA|nr:unnamed protein product [Phytophthora fragariaefolia]
MPPMALDASEATPSDPVLPSSSISTGTEASVPGVVPLGATDVLGGDAVGAVDYAGDADARGIGENGGLEPLGIAQMTARHCLPRPQSQTPAPMALNSGHRER